MAAAARKGCSPAAEVLPGVLLPLLLALSHLPPLPPLLPPLLAVSSGTAAARRYNFGARQRIWDGGGTLNWLSGFYGSMTVVTNKAAGVVFHNGWLGSPAGSTTAPMRAWDFDWGGYDWMLHSDQWDLFRSDRVREFYTGGSWDSRLIITINDGFNGPNGEYSDWAVAAALIYNCTLTSSQVQQVMGCGLHATRLRLQPACTWPHSRPACHLATPAACLPHGTSVCLPQAEHSTGRTGALDSAQSTLLARALAGPAL